MHLPLLVLLASGPAWSATLTVRADGSGNYSSIPAAIAGASSGDRIEVSAGTWAGPVDFGGKNLELVGVEGSADTIIDGGGAAAVLVFSTGESDLSRVEGFTLQDGTRGLWVDGASPVLVDLVFSGFGEAGQYGGAAYVTGRPVFEDVWFSDNVAYAGGAVFLAGGLSTFRRCTFERNGDMAYDTSEASGGAIYASTADLELEDSTFDGNVGHVGAHVVVNGSAKLGVSGGSFADGASNYGGVAVYSTSWVDVDGTAFEGNAAYYQGGAVYVSGADRVTLTDAIFLDNSVYASGGGGAFYGTSPGDLSVSSCTFTENVATYTYGAGLHVSYPDAVTITGSTFEDNHAYYSGGAFYGYVLYGAMHVTDSTFDGNEASNGSGGALHLDYGTSAVAIAQASFHRNVAGTHGGALYVNDVESDLSDLGLSSNTAGQSGGGLRVDNTRSTRKGTVVRRLELTDNAAGGDGGGLSLARLPGAVVEDVRAIDNTAGGAGGGLHLVDLGALRGTRLWSGGNRAEYGGGAYVAETGAWPPDTSEPVLELGWVVLQQNDARVGGGACLVQGVEASLRQATVVGNHATEAGAGLCLVEQAISVQNTAFAWNTGAAALEPLDGVADDVEVIYSAWFDNAANSGGVLPEDAFPGSTDVSAPPLFAHSGLDADHTDDAWTLAPGSPLIDAGNPATSDPDGSASDIGAMGGPSTWTADFDGDGVGAWLDCDDTDASVMPGAADTWYDGIDANCDGADDFDADGDAVPVGEDCDDADASVAEDCGEDTGEEDTGEDGVTVEDSGGADRMAEERGAGTPRAEDKGGCSTAPGAVGAVWALAAWGLLGRRRRSRGSMLGSRCSA